MRAVKTAPNTTALKRPRTRVCRARRSASPANPFRPLGQMMNPEQEQAEAAQDRHKRKHQCPFARFIERHRSRIFRGKRTTHTFTLTSLARSDKIARERRLDQVNDQNLSVGGELARVERSRGASRVSKAIPRSGLSHEEAARRLTQLWAQPPAGGREAWSADALPAAIRQHSRLRPARGRLRQAHAWSLARRLDHHRRRHHQRVAWLPCRKERPSRRWNRSATCFRPTPARLRDGEARVVPAEDLVPGDIVLLESGDRIPADLRLIDVKNLRTDEAALTGESVPADKSTEPVPENSTVGDREDMAFSGTLVVSGRATGVVVATGAQTELGRINQMLAARRRAGNAAAASDRGIRSYDRESDRLCQRRGLRLWRDGCAICPSSRPSRRSSASRSRSFPRACRR